MIKLNINSLIKSGGDTRVYEATATPYMRKVLS
jgi:hypothetical protein